MISDTAWDAELTSKSLEQRGDNEGTGCPEVIVSISFLSEIPLSFVLGLNLGQGSCASQLVDALVSQQKH